MQLLPATARRFGVKRRRLFDPKANIDAGAAYLDVLARRFGDTRAEWIIAAYNAGPGAVQRYGGVPPYPETQEYVRRVTSLWGHEGTSAVITAVVSPGALVRNVASKESRARA